MKTYRLTYIFLLLLIGGGGTGCKKEAATTDQQDTVSEPPAEVEMPSVVIQAEAFTGTEGEFKTETNAAGDTYVYANQEVGWLSYALKVPAAGRYKVEVHALSPEGNTLTFWVEDYIDNKDGRTYNVTGNMEWVATGEGEDFRAVSKDGSPLNEGTHNIRLHVKGNKAAVDWIKFTLMRPHEITPESMTQSTAGENWEVVWSDEFEGEGLVDESKWTYDVGDWGWGNNELQYYTDKRLKNARMEGGNLIIEAHKNDEGNTWSSARLTTRGKTSFLYGRIEFRAKCPPNKGNWAAGWTLGDDYRDELSWPYCGEIDILESVGYQMDNETGNGKAHASVHCGAYYFKLGNQPTATIEVENMHEEFHTYAVDWTPEGIKAYVDGNQYFEYTDTSTELSWPFAKPQNIILNLAMGGGWGGLEGMDESVTTQQFVIDYVRVYALK